MVLSMYVLAVLVQNNLQLENEAKKAYAPWTILPSRGIAPQEKFQKNSSSETYPLSNQIWQFSAALDCMKRDPWFCHVPGHIVHFSPLYPGLPAESLQRRLARAFSFRPQTADQISSFVLFRVSCVELFTTLRFRKCWNSFVLESLNTNNFR